MQQHINLHTLGYSILANLSERNTIERDITLKENSVWLLIFQNEVKMHVNLYKQQHKFAYNIKLINFMRILSGAANYVLHKCIQS